MGEMVDHFITLRFGGLQDASRIIDNVAQSGGDDVECLEDHLHARRAAISTEGVLVIFQAFTENGMCMYRNNRIPFPADRPPELPISSRYPAAGSSWPATSGQHIQAHRTNAVPAGSIL
ncbi:hypothetical protein CcaCcLH18_02864 [Colletotrichum camelliae]|nr:hypothetical protein CcaCcLH18_02864 [Colletotrichum camelliae]